MFDNKNILKVTGEHPFYLNGEWVVAKDLNVGDELLTIDGKIARIIGIKDVNENVDVYNIEAEEYNDFIVGQGIIVHNSDAVESIPQIEQRLESGGITLAELDRIDYANYLLEKNGLSILTPEQERALLLSHYSNTGNIDKVWRLGEAGLSNEQITLLGDNWVFGDNLISLSEELKQWLVNAGVTSKEAKSLLTGVNSYDQQIEILKRIMAEKKFLPGGKTGGYMPLSNLQVSSEVVLNEVDIFLAGNQVLRNGKPVQGLSIGNGYIEFVGYHFTSQIGADNLYNQMKFERINPFDPYIYFSESGWFTGKSQNEIRQVLGAKSAQDVVIVKIRYPLNKAWLKAEPGKPIKIAFDGDIIAEDLLKRKGILMEIKDINDL